MAGFSGIKNVVHRTMRGDTAEAKRFLPRANVLLQNLKIRIGLMGVPSMTSVVKLNSDVEVFLRVNDLTGVDDIWITASPKVPEEKCIGTLGELIGWHGVFDTFPHAANGFLDAITQWRSGVIAFFYTFYSASDANNVYVIRPIVPVPINVNVQVQTSDVITFKKAVDTELADPANVLRTYNIAVMEATL